MEDRGRIPSSSDFGKLLRHYRIAAGLSQEALAERARMSTNGISALERGYRHTPQRGTLTLLVGALALNDDQRADFEASAARSVLLGRGSVTVGPWADGATANLPLSLTTFVGREAELREIGALVLEHRLVTLTGAGGIGKTQTALQVGAALRDATNDAVWLIELAPVDDPTLLARTIASTLGVQEVPGRALLETLVAYLKHKTMLLILDNCEHVITEAAIVAGTLLSACPRVRILATSREALSIAGEHTYRLPSLSVPPSGAAVQLGATEAATYGAIVLFTDRARVVDHRFTLTDENTLEVAAICRQLDGIPLAIELAAARMNNLSIKAIAEALHDGFRVLSRGPRTALPRHRTMRAAIDWSYDLLSAPEQRVFERLSVFAGSCTLATSAAVCAGNGVAHAEVFDILSSLVDKSLIVADVGENEPRYRFLESFRHYAREKLMARGEAEAVARRHGFACLELAERLECAYDTESDEIWRTLADKELENWRVALRWALIERGDVVLGQRLVGELNVLWRSAPLEGRRWIDVALEFVDEQTPMKVLGRLAYAEAFVAHQLREYKTELAASERAIACYRIVGDSVGVARAQSLAGHALTYLDRLDEATTLLEQALVTARAENNRQLVAYVLRCLADASNAEHDVIAARLYVEEALQILQPMGAGLAIARAHNDLSQFERWDGNAELGLTHARKALAAFQTFSDVGLVAEALDNVSQCLVSLARYDEAEECAREALELACEHQRAVHACWALECLVAIAALRTRLAAEREPTTFVRAARILGCVDARFAALGSVRAYVQVQEYDRVLARLREALGAHSLAKVMAEGAVMTLEHAIEEALEISPRSD